MRAFSLEQIVEITNAEIVSSQVTQFTGVGTDTRVDLSGQLFIALKGESFDAHQFLQKAYEQKAAGLLVHELNPAIESLKDKITILKVPDTLRALQQMGRFSRHQSRAMILGITGSNGKTTTKEFAAALIGSARSVHYNKGSFNNHWGVPFTLLQLPENVDVALIEMGMNHPGELTELAQIAEPNVVICTMVGRAHMEFFGTLEKVAEAKEEIYKASPQAVQIYNLDNKYTHNMYVESTAAKRLTFSAQDSKADVHLVIQNMTMNEIEVSGHIQETEGTVKVPVFGAQNLNNLMAAATLALAAGLNPQDIWSGLSLCRTNWGRNQLVNLRSGGQIIFDAYNANPDSMKALIDNIRLLTVPGRKVGVFGQMREMGSISSDLHKELGEWVGVAGFDEVFFIGEDHPSFAQGLSKVSYKGKVHIASDYNETLGREFAQGLQKGDIAVMKASRGTRLERFMNFCEPLDFQAKT